MESNLLVRVKEKQLGPLSSTELKALRRFADS